MWLFRGMRLSDNCGTRPALNGLLDGLLFNRKPFRCTQIWTSISTFQVMRMWKDLPVRLVLQSLVLLLRPLLIIHHLMIDLQGSFVFDVDFFSPFSFICPPWGLVPNTCVALFSINICFFMFWLRALYFSFFFFFFDLYNPN